MQAFAHNKYQVLVTTDVASRGLDLLQVSHVINFDLPKHPEEYVHRIGRTGRAGQQGVAYSFVSPKDWNSLQAIEGFLRRPLEFTQIDGLIAKFNGQMAVEKKPKPVKKATSVKSPKVKTSTQAVLDGDAPMPKKKKIFFEGGDDGALVVKKKQKIN